jgi:carboxymethylenebutenolidase
LRFGTLALRHLLQNTVLWPETGQREQMREEKVEIKTGDGIADGFVYAPDAQGPLPAVLYYPDGIGIRPAFHEMAKRLAGEGYVVLLPNIYWN